MAETEVLARFPPKLSFLFEPHRYKVAYGGRGSAKSWSFARALLIKSTEQRLRILCTREVQKSIKDSVHQLLSDQIESLGYGHLFTILRDEIRGPHGSQFLFAGLSDLTVESIKSFEGVDIVWVEEARAVTKRSWGILIPTIRRDGSEIWASYNPELDTDDTHKRFALDPPPDAVVVKMTYRDNPWFSDVLEKERAHSQLTDPDEYDNIWEGNCKAAVAGAIYAKEVAAAQAEGRICNVPYEPRFKVHVICDLGFNDQMSIILAQRHLSEIRVIDYIEDSLRTLDSYSAELREKRLNWGTMFLPHDAKHKTLAASGHSAQSIMEKLGWKTAIVPDIGVEPGIKAARMALARTYVERTKAARLLECLKRYRRNVPATTGEPGSPVHDEHSHGADAYRYMAIIADHMKNEDTNFMKPLEYSNAGIR